ncbi:putative colanic acid biosynthesis UDP-glucose lipid carrier transferase [Dysgonomonas alginatilytica]|uniref:Putative colanic acid biosynthesis UDP-glucose lipid carrier transferase n=1 Tax=Dysgonomonas alginatilytica TaxID=1605892 RepID=A0A2V3PM21_9BACT|nr:undecaprenyl-phosphate glucose phosphotransferase [Dysgonomonas alginatilytica]PXV62465.1 putative colanic acid biosynthesis UDP-glucose lipid carrier transferase [Dysgonomonas alginatilytica]
MELTKRKDGFGHLIKWIIRLGDLILINLCLILLSNLLFSDNTFTLFINNVSLGEIFLLINLIYFVVVSIIPINLSSNIIFFDKVVHRSFLFISLYFILLTAGMLLLGVGKISFDDWLIFFCGLAFSYILWHIAVRMGLKLYRSKGYNYKRIVIIGSGNNALNVYNELKSSDYGYKVLGLFDDNPDFQNSTLNYLGTLSQVDKFCIENKVDEIYCTLPNNEESAILRLVNFSEKNMIRFFLIPEFYGYIRRKLVLNSLQSIPLIGIRPEPLQLVYNRILKRTFDIVFSFIVLITVYPIIYIVFGIIIKLTSHGPVVFRQRRTGLQGKEFTCYKFRTMHLNDKSDSLTTQHTDPRITPIGRFMRRTSMDELPQFFNVLIGNMSVVGPRPHMTKQTNLYNGLIDKFMIRHMIKPGITGWAQISGYRGETKTIEQMEGRFKRDVWYIENWSFMLDIKIIVVTTLQLLKGDENVY